MNILPIIKLLRPHQWLKNLLVLFPPFFAGKISDPAVTEKIIPVLIAFSLAASSSYIINDVRDIKADGRHHDKRKRAVARGTISISSALVLAVILLVASVLLAASVSEGFQGLLVLYIFISAVYTFLIKSIAIADILFISIGYVIRVLSGGEAFSIPVSSWLFLTVFMVALLLAAGKRLGEMVSLGNDAHKHRKSLLNYSPQFLYGILWFCASVALVMYALYIIEHNRKLLYTILLAVFGLLRYIYVAGQGKGDPTDALLKDNQIMIVGGLWLCAIGIVLYL